MHRFALIRKPRVIDHDVLVRSDGALPCADPEVFANAVTTPLGSERLHGVPRGAVAQQRVRRLFLVTVEVSLLAAERGQHGLERASEPDARVAVTLGQDARDSRLAGGDAARDGNDAGFY